MGIPLDHHQLRNLDAAGLAYAAYVVPSQVHEHDVLCALLWVRDEFGGQRVVFLLARASPPGARNGPEVDTVTLEPDHDLRRSAYDGRVATAKKIHVRRRIDQAKRPVDLVRFDADPGFEPLGRHDLEDVPRLDKFLGLEHR